MTKRVAVLVSGSGTNLQALLDHPDLGGQIVLVLSDRLGVHALERAEAKNVPSDVVAFADYDDRSAWDHALAARIDQAEPDLVVLAGFMRILAPDVVTRWPMINTHPSLLPAFPGAHAVRDALDHGVKVTGCTVHFVVAEVDAGPIIAQEAVTVAPGDTEETLHARIKAVEHRLLCEAVRTYCKGGS